MDREVKELEKALEQIWDIALKFGLDPFPTHFEIVPATVMYEIGSYALPGRYSHWTFGKAYHRMKTMYDYGLSKIYEVVINTNPSYGFLLETNSLLQNKLVIAHVLGHVDFFKHNAYFSRTNRRMVDEVSVHADRIGEYEFKYGRKTVEEFLDAVLSIEEHIDPNFFIKKAREGSNLGRPANPVTDPYGDLFPEEAKKAKEQAEENKRAEAAGGPTYPEKDLVWFISRYSPSLEPWQRDVMSMIHEEMLYFVPQMQTKIMNEGWACATGDSLVLTDRGFIRFDALYESGRYRRVAGGDGDYYRITDFHKEENVATIRIRTRRGLTIEGSREHRVRLTDGTFRYLKDITPGDRIGIDRGANLWPTEKLKVGFTSTEPSVTLHQVAALAGVSYWTVLRHLRGKSTRNAPRIAAALTTTAYQPGHSGKILPTRTPLDAPMVLDEEVAWLLGYFVGDGNRTQSGICLTTGDEATATRLGAGLRTSFGLSPRVFWDACANNGQGGRWRVIVHSRDLLDWIEGIGINLDDRARTKSIPATILKSPKSVVSAFLRGYFDADAHAGGQGVILVSASEELIRSVQIVLLNYGILSTQHPKKDGCVHLHIAGKSARLFRDEIGFSLPCKQEVLDAYLDGHQWFKEEPIDDEIVSIEEGRADVYDITVDTKHAYVANGLVHHNSIWHARIMRELDLEGAEYVEFADLHSGVVSPQRGQLNPYYLGYKMWEDIERRWDNPTEDERKRLGRKAGEGRQKIFEVRESENDVSFLRNYLTEELCEDMDLLVYELVDEEAWTVTEKRWERVRNQLVANMTNFGFPYIEVTDGDYNRNRELYLTHRYEGTELDMKYARKVLEYVYRLWGRPVHLETRSDDEPLVLHYDGYEHDED